MQKTSPCFSGVLVDAEGGDGGKVGACHQDGFVVVLMVEDDGEFSAGFVRAANFFGKERAPRLDECGASLRADGDGIKPFAHKHQGEAGGPCVGKGSETRQGLGWNAGWAGCCFRRFRVVDRRRGTP